MDERQKTIQEVREFNYNWKDISSLKFYGKHYNELTRDEQLDLEDIIASDNE